MYRELHSQACTTCHSARLPSFFFFNDTATTEIYTLSLHDALPILLELLGSPTWNSSQRSLVTFPTTAIRDRKSTRLNSSHLVISYAVFCLKKKKTTSHCYLMFSHDIRRYLSCTRI